MCEEAGFPAGLAVGRCEEAFEGGQEFVCCTEVYALDDFVLG